MPIVYERYGFSEDFQKKVIACAIRNPEKFETHADLFRPEYFTTTVAFEAVYRLREYREQYSNWPDFSMLANYAFTKLNKLNPEKAEEVVGFVQELGTIDTTDSDAVYDLVRDFAKERKLYRAIRTAHTALMEGKEVEGGVVQLFEQALEIGNAGEDLGILINDDWEKVLTEHGVESQGVPCGRYQLFHEIWRNGWEPGWLVVPLAPPKRFKTTFCINLANGIAGEIGHPHDVIYYACEISQRLAALRALCNMTGFSMNDVFDAREKMIIATRGQIGRMQGRLLFKSFASKSATISSIKAHAKRAIKILGLKPKAIIIDYAETVRTEGTEKMSEWKQSAEVYTQARAMGVELDCVVIMPDRCKAEFVDKPVPSMRAFQGSFEKAGIVDIAIGLCQTEQEHVQNRMRYFIFLNRHGREMVHLAGKVDPERFQMTVDEEIPYDPDEANNANNGGQKHRGGAAPAPVIGVGIAKPKKSKTKAGQEANARLAEDDALDQMQHAQSSVRRPSPAKPDAIPYE